MGSFEAQLVIDDEEYSTKIHVVENLPVGCIIGKEFLKEVEACFSNGNVTIRQIGHVLPVIVFDENEMDLQHVKFGKM